MVSTEDRKDILLVNRYRLSLSKPPQSFFRVVALLFYEEVNEKLKQSSKLPPWVPQRTDDGRSYIVGTNDEPGFMGGSICAERSTIVQLRFLPSARVTKLVICTDSTEPIAPGMLCREFMAGHDCIPWDLRIISTGCKCTQCDKRDGDLFMDDGIKEGCVDGIPILDTTLRALYPYPSPYTRCNSSQSVSFGETYSQSTSSILLTESKSDPWKQLLKMATKEASANISENHPIQFGAAVSFADGTFATSRQISALEYGCSLDAVSQLAPHFRGKEPHLLVQVDQYGVAHSPFAPARAFLSENENYKDCKILVHTTGASANAEDAANLASWSLTIISVSDLAPNAPDWTSSTPEREHIKKKIRQI
ncbi:unnamed protein product [Cylindrotheca closterium]|uniref:Cytidine deaminase n=1 Tax=Cylindrotheca closterium TaxID=2856 RepID=A0AAD2PW20_9STRA|nr:unnamed protein product [Cylindrotheca closterium]